VYGLLGLFPDYQLHLQVDYAIDVPVLFYGTLAVFEEHHKVLSAEYLRRSLGLSWSQLYSVLGIPTHVTSPFVDHYYSDNPSSISVTLTLQGTVSEIESRRQVHTLRAVGDKHEPNRSRRRYFTFRVSPSTNENTYSYGICTSEPLVGDRVQVFLETRTAVICREVDGGKVIAVGGAILSASTKDCLALLGKSPDDDCLSALQDGLFSGLEAMSLLNGVTYFDLTVQALEGVLRSTFAK
jgi:hypothetical protein